MGFPGSTVVENPPPNARDTGGTGSIPGQGTISHMSLHQNTITENRSNIITNSIKNLKIVHSKKKKKKERKSFP